MRPALGAIPLWCPQNFWNFAPPLSTFRATYQYCLSAKSANSLTPPQCRRHKWMAPKSYINYVLDVADAIYVSGSSSRFLKLPWTKFYIYFQRERSRLIRVHHPPQELGIHRQLEVKERGKYLQGEFQNIIPTRQIRECFGCRIGCYVSEVILGSVSA